MVYTKTKAVDKILALPHRLKVVQGGTSAGKTIAILLILIDIAQTRPGLLISVVSETMPHLKKGAMRDFINIMQGHGYFKEDSWDRTNFIYTFETGSQMEFFSADSSDKVRGPRRDILFINECNNVPYETYTQLAIRTNGDIYLDYNPVTTFWVHEEIMPKYEHSFVVLTYKDNDALSVNIVKEIESRKDSKLFWQVYGLGQLGDVQGRIYQNWAMIDEIPHEAKLERYGLDFGYTNDPTAIVAVYRYNNGFILDEVLYQKGLSNKQIADTLLAQEEHGVLIVADAAEPKSIDELRMFGLNVVPCVKGKDSVRNGIQIVQDQRISVTKRSVNLIKEYRNATWMTDREGRILNIPEPGFDHLLDGVRYAIVSMPKVYTAMTPKEKEDLIFRQAMARKNQSQTKGRRNVFLDVFNR